MYMYVCVCVYVYEYPVLLLYHLLYYTGARHAAASAGGRCAVARQHRAARSSGV